MILKNKKGESGNWDVLIGFIVAIIALLLILGLFFRADLMNWMRNLPNYGNPDGKDREVILENDPILNSVATCEVVGEIITTPKSSGVLAGLKYIFIKEKLADVKINGKTTDVILYNDKNYLQIMLYEGNFAQIGDEDLGRINSGKIEIYLKWLNDDVLRSEHPRLPSKEDLTLINEAYLGGANGLTICKKKNE